MTGGVQSLDGLDGNDVILGGTFADAIDGGAGNDTLYGRNEDLGYSDTDFDTLRAEPATIGSTAGAATLHRVRRAAT
ncbi:MAG: hypothetical protein ACXW3P_01520 [Rhodospirillales bacterium]